MDYDNDLTFSKALLAGVFIGFFDTLICLGYNIAYRNVTGYEPSMLINVSSLIFGVNIIFMLFGLAYSLFVKYFGRRDIFFDIVILIAAVFLGWQTEIGRRFADHVVNNEFKGLLLGVVIIIALGALTIPLLYRSKLLHKYVM